MKVKNNKWLCVNIKLLLDSEGKVIYFKELSYKSRIATFVEMFSITRAKLIIFYDNDVNKELIEEFKNSINVDYKWLKNVIVYIRKSECLELIKSNNIKEYFICDLNDKEWLKKIIVLKGFDEVVKYADNIIETLKVKTKLIRVVTDEQYRKIKENNLIYKIEKAFYNPCSYAYFDPNDIRHLFNNKEIISIYNEGKLIK